MPEAKRERRSKAWADHGRFFRGWLRNPRSVGALFPSSSSLAKLLVTGIRPGAKVIELGAGTGTVTQAILDAGVSRGDLLLLEKDKSFAKLLVRRFPGVDVVNADAGALDRYASRLDGPADFIISGLPLVLFSAEEKNRLLEHVFATLGDKGRLHQFTYVGRCPVPREQLAALGARAALIGVALFNVPPAFVYRLRRASVLERARPSLLRTSLRLLGRKSRRPG
jgi:phospholipid N-methyltransferase